MTINFNRIYVIQSLSKANGDELTGQQLFDDVLQYFNTKYGDKDARIFNVDNKKELLHALENIKSHCETDGIKPIIHFEIHGLEDKTGLSLNQEDVNWGDIYVKFIEINAASKWNLFITMGVCFGNYSMLLIRPSLPAPFTGILGSFEELFEWDLYIRYNAFYQELLNSLDFEKALEALHDSNPALPDDYRYINSEQTFKNVYQKYFDTQFSDVKIKERFNLTIAEEKISFTNRNIKRQFYSKFRTNLLNTKKEFFIKDKRKFFMFDVFPGHQYIYCVNWEPNYH
ncbi:hypothetical protein [Cytophaga hutchinsonii]|uniref:Uncharacterized protein n=1 Tax=Cytophaga hutchinsonii (strain ATCC 33406 / DSM 1761 / CIP 103989 / NBRC 15051 / NCIMB 9469 / D465) TaxID=269798 RepID=A0A6N4SV39_CYTH3|nr:hypothetical protein [Cytophaga hutchinsonii]ABG60186.1 hypothetical protein CHU_2944 [Cytophaga hutchinsonii ATCC 33406]SFX22414.1 hypothetical protein SAMN04487930_102117 [Cytophaga hutchinsonii ATCC 33406]